jgi:addiction module HigA family antidote
MGTKVMNIEIPRHRRPSTPGDMIREYLDDEELDFTQQQLADALGMSRGRLNEIINGRRTVTADTAMRLERVLGPSMEFWLGLQLAVDIYDAKHGPQARSIAKLKRLVRRAA